jgi:uncharacterized membrane protein
VFFIGPLAFSAVAAGLLFGADGLALGLIATALVLQLAMAGITLRVNVPLNDGIKAAGAPDEIDVGAARREFREATWVRWNNVRTAAAIVAFGLLAWALVLTAGA